jgi:hypothetical protein
MKYVRAGMVVKGDGGKKAWVGEVYKTDGNVSMAVLFPMKKSGGNITKSYVLPTRYLEKVRK